MLFEPHTPNSRRNPHDQQPTTMNSTPPTTPANNNTGVPNLVGSGGTGSRTTGGTLINSHTNQRDFLIFSGRSDPRQFLKHYKLACLANEEDTKDDYVRLLSLSLAKVTSEWYLDLTDVDWADCGTSNNLFLK